MSSITVELIDDLSGVKINNRIVFFGCWHEYTCSMFTSHVSKKSSLRAYDVKLTQTNLESKSSITRDTDNLQDCICHDSSIWHYACCKQATFCPECDSSEYQSAVCDGCLTTRNPTYYGIGLMSQDGNLWSSLIFALSMNTVPEFDKLKEDKLKEKADILKREMKKQERKKQQRR